LRSISKGCFKLFFGGLLAIIPDLDIAMAVDVLLIDLEAVSKDSVSGVSSGFLNDNKSLRALVLVIENLTVIAQELTEIGVSLEVLLSMLPNILRVLVGLFQVTRLDMDQELHFEQATEVQLILNTLSFKASHSDGISAIFVPLLSKEDVYYLELGTEPQLDVRMRSLVARLHFFLHLSGPLERSFVYFFLLYLSLFGDGPLVGLAGILRLSTAFGSSASWVRARNSFR